MTSIRNRKHSVNHYAAAFSILALPAFAHAETAPAADADTTTVVVTGQRTPYKSDVSNNRKATADLLNTPQTITVIGKDLMREQGATTLSEALRNAPGVGTFYLGENGSTSTGDAVFMRGSDVSGNIFVDGVRDVASISRDVFNIDSVEVLKGAAGTDIGRGAATGAISLWSKHANLRDAFSGSVAAGAEGYVRATADLNWHITDGNAFRLNLMDQDGGVPGRDAIKNTRWGIAPSLGFGLEGHTRVYFDALHVEQDNVPDGGVSTIGLPGYSTPDPGTRDFLNSAPRADPNNFYGTNDDHDSIETNAMTATIEHDLSDTADISNLTRWSRTGQDYQLTSFLGQGLSGTRPLRTPDPADPSTWTLTRYPNNKDTVNTLWANQTNLRAHVTTGAIAHSLSAGVELTREEQKSWTFDTTAAAGAYPPASVYDPDPGVSGYHRIRTGYTFGRTDTTAVYVNDTMAFGRAWQLTAGLRYDHYKTTFDTVLLNGSKTGFAVEDDLLTGKLGLVWKPAADASVYASYAVTKQPPGGATFTLVNTANVNNPDVEPQEAKSSEIGGKWDLLHDRLSLTGAVYRTEYADAIAQDTDGTFYRTGDKSVSGVELGMVGQITHAWNISAGYTVMNTRVKNQAPVTADGSYNLTYSPSDAFTLWTTFTPGKRLTFGGGVRYNGEMKRGSDGAIGTPAFVKSYAVWDGVAKYRLTRQVELQLNVYNLFDKTYVAAINKSGYRYTPGTPRTVRLTANFSF